MEVYVHTICVSTSKFLISWFYDSIANLVGSDQSNVISGIDGSINVIKIKSVGSGGTNGTHTKLMRGDGQAVCFRSIGSAL